MTLTIDWSTIKVDLLALIGQDTQIPHKPASKGQDGPEYHTACPWCGGKDRFCIWPEHSSGRGRYWCRQCEHEGDAVSYLQDKRCMTFADAVAFLAADQRPANGNGHKPAIVATFIYHTADGSIAYRAERIEPGKDGRRKDFRLSRPDGRDGWTYDVKGVERVLYRLPELLAEPGEPVLFVEGEAKADLLANEGHYLATAIAGGSNGTLPDLTALTGRDVAILPDNDPPGRKFAEKLSDQLTGIAASVRIVILPGLHDSGDVIDWRAAGHTWGELNTLLAAAQPSSGLSLGWLTTDQVMAMSAMDYLIPDVLPAGGLTMLYGSPEAGKTFIALDWCATLALQGKRVLYVATEGQRGIGPRLKAWQKHHGAIIPSDGLLQLHQPPNLLNDAEFVALLNDAELLHPDLIVFDTLSDMFAISGADENSATDVGRVILAFNEFQRKTGSAVLVLHHPTKAGNWERGSGKVRGSCDLIVEATNADGAITLSCSKSKDAAHFEDKYYQVIPVDGTDSCAIVPGEKVAHGMGELTPKEKAALEVLAMSVFADVGAKAAVIAAEAKIHPTAIYKILSRLEDRGLVQHSNKGEPYRLTAAGREKMSVNIVLAD